MLQARNGTRTLLGCSFGGVNEEHCRRAPYDSMKRCPAFTPDTGYGRPPMLNSLSSAARSISTPTPGERYPSLSFSSRDRQIPANYVLLSGNNRARYASQSRSARSAFLRIALTAFPATRGAREDNTRWSMATQRLNTCAKYRNKAKSQWCAILGYQTTTLKTLQGNLAILASIRLPSYGRPKRNCTTTPLSNFAQLAKRQPNASQQ